MLRTGKVLLETQLKTPYFHCKLPFFTTSSKTLKLKKTVTNNKPLGNNVFKLNAKHFLLTGLGEKIVDYSRFISFCRLLKIQIQKLSEGNNLKEFSLGFISLML